MTTDYFSIEVPTMRFFHATIHPADHQQWTGYTSFTYRQLARSPYCRHPQAVLDWVNAESVAHPADAVVQYWGAYSPNGDWYLVTQAEMERMATQQEVTK